MEGPSTSHYFNTQTMEKLTPQEIALYLLGKNIN